MNEVYVKRESLGKWVAKYFYTDIVTIDELIGCIEDLDGEIENLKDRIEDMEEEMRTNYKPIPFSEMYGISERDPL